MRERKREGEVFYCICVCACVCCVRVTFRAIFELQTKLMSNKGAPHISFGFGWAPKWVGGWVGVWFVTAGSHTYRYTHTHSASYMYMHLITIVVAFIERYCCWLLWLLTHIFANMLRSSRQSKRFPKGREQK